MHTAWLKQMTLNYHQHYHIVAARIWPLSEYKSLKAQ